MMFQFHRGCVKDASGIHDDLGLGRLRTVWSVSRQRIVEPCKMAPSSTCTSIDNGVDARILPGVNMLKSQMLRPGIQV